MSPSMTGLLTTMKTMVGTTMKMMVGTTMKTMVGRANKIRQVLGDLYYHYIEMDMGG